MIRTSLQNRKQITKLMLHRETVRALGDTELAVVIGGEEPRCVGDTNRLSTCPTQFEVPW